ncbi:hypothetical protein E2C01_081871 [Portunus trituberculatus]|uniref:Uncharacterized protein n=1 Tax=Portunus trituberculatus TaxID=210409 RepID=A0A5B7IT03_PORTR|nr:hypothetical protein [Portunus trituberculatus]
MLGDDGNDVNAEEVDERQHYGVMDKEDLISYALRLEKELTRKNNIIQSLTLQRDWIIEKKDTRGGTQRVHGSSHGV